MSEPNPWREEGDQWISEEVTHKRTQYWRGHFGEYLSDLPHSPFDINIGHEDKTIVRGVLAGAYPDRGVVTFESGQLPTTEVNYVRTSPPVFYKDTP